MGKTTPTGLWAKKRRAAAEAATRFGYSAKAMATSKALAVLSMIMYSVISVNVMMTSYSSSTELMSLQNTVCISLESWSKSLADS